MPLLLIPDELVRRSITAAECVDAVAAGFLASARGEVSHASGRFLWRDGQNSMNLYAAHMREHGLASKVLTACEGNPGMGQPYIQALITLHDPETGLPEAILDGSYLTALRTAASVAVGARTLARPDARVLGILGTGLQARTHLLCHLAALPFDRVVVWGRNPVRVAEYLREMAPQVSVALEACASPEAVCAQADVIACTTRSREPLFDAAAVRPGSHVGVAGPLRDDGTEVPLDLVRSHRLYVDTLAKFLPLWRPDSAPRVDGELDAVLAGSAPGRTTGREITVYKPVGMAFQDLVTARIVLDRVRESGAGIAVDW